MSPAGVDASMMSVQWGSASDAGQVREINEDSYLAGPSVFVVADGMGGHSAGEVASAIAVDEFRPLAGAPELRTDDILESIAQANRKILDSGARSLGRAGMGTTLAGLGVVRAGGCAHWAVFNIGDSRVYRLQGGELRQVSVDHSEVHDLVAAGRITAEQARTHPDRNVVTRSLGTDPAPAPDLWVFPPVAGDRFLVCSDGLTRELDDAQIADVLSAEPVAQEAAAALVQRAVAAGGRDNVTVLVVDFAGERSDALGQDEVDEDTAPRVHPVGGF